MRTGRIYTVKVEKEMEVMSTRDITFTAEERKMLLYLVDKEWASVNADREATVGRLEAQHLATQQELEKIQGKLR